MTPLDATGLHTDDEVLELIRSRGRAPDPAELQAWFAEEDEPEYGLRVGEPVKMTAPRRPAGIKEAQFEIWCLRAAYLAIAVVLLIFWLG